MLSQDAHDDARIGHTRDFDVVQVICDPEPLDEGQFKRMHACAARMDKCAIDVEKKQALVRFCHIERFVILNADKNLSLARTLSARKDIRYHVT